MQIKPIRTKADYERTLREIERLWGAEKGTPEGDRLDVLATLVEAYEQKHFPIDPPDPIEAIRFRLEPGARSARPGRRDRWPQPRVRSDAAQARAFAGDDPPPPPALRHPGRSAHSLHPRAPPRRVARQRFSLVGRPPPPYNQPVPCIGAAQRPKIVVPISLSCGR